MIGIPYMGSKRKLSKKILDYIVAHNPNATHFYDLFGGGGAISFEVLKRKQFKTVFYNDFNTGVVEFLKEIIKNGVTYKYYNWIDKFTFDKHKSDNDWFGGFVKTCWSFGNDQKSYLYGKNIEEPKRRMHEIVVNCCNESLNWFNNTYSTEISNLIFNLKTIEERRLYLKNYCIKIQNIQQLKQLEHLERLQHLKNLKNIQERQKLVISNLSYELVKVETPIDKTIIYCDPPYKGKKKYEKNIEHDLFLDWVKNSNYKVYVSSYELDLPLVKEFTHRSTLASTANNKVVERLFCNQIEIIKTQLF